MRKIKNFSIESVGQDHAQYWQGVGVAHTEWDTVFTGVGENASEAYEDAVEMMACADWDVSKMPKRPRGIRKTDCVIHASQDDDETLQDDEMGYYVVIYVSERLVFGTIEAPAFLASYYINGDASDITDEEQVQADAFLTAENVRILSCADDVREFAQFPPVFGNLRGDMLTYTTQEV